MKRYHITLEGEPFDVEILDDPRQHQVRVRVNGELLRVEVEEQTEKESPPPSLPAPISRQEEARPAEGTITAPLPGVVKSIAVHPKERVDAGDELLVIEAMKMDNVIRSPRSGTVAAIHATEGRQVTHGESLLELEE